MYLDLSLNMLDISSFHIDKVKLAHIAIKFRNQFLTAARCYQLLVYKHKFINLSMPARFTSPQKTEGSSFAFHKA